jgi:hypothetical protein
VVEKGERSGSRGEEGGPRSPLSTFVFDPHLDSQASCRDSYSNMPHLTYISYCDWSEREAAAFADPPCSARPSIRLLPNPLPVTPDSRPPKAF